MIAPLIPDRDDPDRLPPLDHLQTGRLQLRIPRLADADAIAEGLATYAVARMLPLIPWPYDRQDALDWLLPRTTGMLPGWSLAVTPDGERYLGTASIDRVEGRWSLGYWLGVNHWGKGVMSEAARALAFECPCGQSRLARPAAQAGVPHCRLAGGFLQSARQDGTADRNGT